MGIDHKAAALGELRIERAELHGRVEKLTDERDQVRDRLMQLENDMRPLVDRLRQLDMVIEPLMALVGVPEDGPEHQLQNLDSVLPGFEPAVEQQTASDDGWAVPDVFKRYMPKGGDGKRKRLRSTLMVSDVVDKLGEPVTKERLRDAFFDYFGREDIEKFWDRPDNALNTAIARARDEDLIIEVKVEGRPPLYSGHFRDAETHEPAFPALHIEEGR